MLWMWYVTAIFSLNFFIVDNLWRSLKHFNGRRLLFIADDIQIDDWITNVKIILPVRSHQFKRDIKTYSDSLNEQYLANQIFLNEKWLDIETVSLIWASWIKQWLTGIPYRFAFESWTFVFISVFMVSSISVRQYY